MHYFFFIFFFFLSRLLCAQVGILRAPSEAFTEENQHMTGFVSVQEGVQLCSLASLRSLELGMDLSAWWN